MNKLLKGALLITISLPLLGLMTKPLASQPELLEQFMDELVGARLASDPVKILDVGSGNGGFQRRMKQFLDKRGVSAEVWGVDDYRYLGEHAREFWSMVRGDMPDFTVLFSDVKKLSPKMDKTFDYIFVNSPYPANQGEIIEASVKLAKDDGYVIVRYYVGDEISNRPQDKLLIQASLMNWKVVKQTIKLPEGDYLLSYDAYFVMKGEDNPLWRFQFNKVFGARLAERSA